MLFKKQLYRYSYVEWLLFGVVFFFNSPWPFWGAHFLGGGMHLMYGCVLLLCYKFSHDGRLKNNHSLLLLSIILLYFALFQVQNELHLSYIFIAIAFYMANYITRSEAESVIDMSLNYLFLSIIIPLPLWLIHQFVTPIPDVGTLDIAWKGDDVGVYKGQCLNHIFFVTINGLDAMRFYSWYDEPGVLGTFASFILWAKKYDFYDKRVLVVFLGTLFTFSAAYFVLTLLGLFYRNIGSLRKIIIIVLALFIIGYTMYVVLEDNLAFQQSVVTRVLNPQEHGVNSRVGDDINKMWENSNNKLFGMGSGTVAESSSYKTFLINYGYFGFFLVLLCYLSLMRKKTAEKWFTLLLFVASFAQRPQLFTAFQFSIFSCIMLIFSTKNNYTHNIN